MSLSKRWTFSPRVAGAPFLAVACLLVAGCVIDPVQRPPVTHVDPATGDTTVFVVVERMPEAVRGDAAIRRLARRLLPEEDAGIRGTVIVQFVVNEDGNTSDIECIQDAGGGTCEAASEAVRRSNFRPGRRGGQPVRIRIAMPIEFGR